MISTTVSSLTFPCTCCEAIILSQQPVHHGIPVRVREQTVNLVHMRLGLLSLD
jgi:hypothetical protein